MKTKLLVLLVLMCCLAGCGKGVNIDENEVIDGNGTGSLTKGGVVYSCEGDNIYKNGELLVTVEGIKDGKLFALGEYLYVNTKDDGSKQIRLDGSKVRTFGAGDILTLKGRWIYYMSDKSRVRGMSLYKVDMKNGKELLMYEGETKSFEENDGIFTFVTEDGRIYENALNDDTAIDVTNEKTEEETEEETASC